MRIERFAVDTVHFAGARHGFLVRLHDADGRFGVGEASPLPSYSPDDGANVPAILERVAAALRDVGDDASSIDLALAPFEDVLAPAPASRFAIETALLDLAGKRQKKPVSQLLSDRPNERVAVNGVLGMDGDADAWLAAALALVERGIRVLKVKVGRGLDFRDELLQLAVLRARIPADVELRLDANGALGVDVHQRLAQLSPLRLRFVEEPVHGEALVLLGTCDVPWAADESLADPRIAARVLEAPGCGALVLKPALLGGLWRCKKLAEKAADRGIGVVVTHLFDGSVAHAACCELALSLERPLACGLDRHEGLGAPSEHLAVPGFVTATGRAGIGAIA